MNEITKYNIRKIMDDNPGYSVVVYSEFLTPKILKKGDNMVPVCGAMPQDWNGKTIWILWPGSYCET